MIADDDADTRTLLARVCNAAGLHVIEAANAQDLLELVAQAQGNTTIDVVISDVAMPGLDGIELTRQLHAAMPSLPIILVTGYAHRGVLQAASKAGARTVLAKPIDPFVLRTLVAAYCGDLGTHGVESEADTEQ